jgi:hypothetical protein
MLLPDGGDQYVGTNELGDLFVLTRAYVDEGDDYPEHVRPVTRS